MYIWFYCLGYSQKNRFTLYIYIGTYVGSLN